MIDIASEIGVSLAEAAFYLPRRRVRKTPHVSTLYRWAKNELKGVRLEVLQIGSTPCTPLWAPQLFFDALAGAEHPEQSRSNSVGIVKSGCRSVVGSDGRATAELGAPGLLG